MSEIQEIVALDRETKRLHKKVVAVTAQLKTLNKEIAIRNRKVDSLLAEGTKLQNEVQKLGNKMAAKLRK